MKDISCGDQYKTCHEDGLPSMVPLPTKDLQDRFDSGQEQLDWRACLWELYGHAAPTASDSEEAVCARLNYLAGHFLHACSFLTTGCR